MSVLDDHPAPWKLMKHGPEGTLYDAKGSLVAEAGNGNFDEPLDRLLQAAPEMLKLLRGYPVRPRGVGLFSPLHQQRVLDWQSSVALLLARIG